MQRVPETDLKYDDAEGVYYLRDQPFTAVAYTTYPDGTQMSETEYHDGLLSGVSRGWWQSGALEAQSHYALNALHGRAQLWHENGQLAEEEDYEHGILVRAKKWSESGALSEEYELSESDPAYKSLLRARQAFGGPRPASD